MVQGISGMRRGPWRAARPWLLASAATLVALAAGRPAQAEAVCTPAGLPSAGATVTCVSDGSTSTGITYDATTPNPGPTPNITLVLDGTAGGALTITSGAVGFESGAVTLSTNSNAPSLITTTGTVAITTTGASMVGLYIEDRSSLASVGITVASGTTIDTSGNFADGARAAAQSSAGSATVTLAGGSIRTRGGLAYGAAAFAGHGDAIVTASGGSITTEGGSSYGLYAQSNVGGARVTIDGSAATTIITSGAGAHGAFASSGGTTGALISLAGDPATVTVTTGGIGAYGLFAAASGAEAASISISGGTIRTGADGAYGAVAVSVTAMAQVTMTGGSVTTGVDAQGVPTGTGAGASGLYAQAVDTGEARVEVTGGTIVTWGAAGGGVLVGGAIAESAGGAATVSITGSITTHGFGAIGAGADGATGATVTLAGAGITTAGQDAYGAYVTLAGAGTAMITIDAASTILTNGFGAHGAYAEVGSGTGGALVANAGSVTTTGLGAAGLYVSVLEGITEIRNTGSVATSGSGAPGILAISGGAVAISSSGSITTTGSNAIGAFAISLAPSSAVALVTVSGSILTGGGGTASGAYGAYASVIGATSGLASVILEGGGSITTTGLGGVAAIADAQGGGDAEVRSAGTIVTQGESGVGAMAQVSGGTGNALVVNTGSVVTAGAGASGLEAGVLLGGTGSATVINNGSVTAAGEAAAGISAYSVGGAVAVTHAGSIATSGTEAHGIRVLASGAATVTSSGSITATGPAASGIYILSAGGGYAVAVTGGTITGGGIDASLGTGAGITILNDASGTIDIAAGATVQAASGIAIQDSGGALALTSRGTILGIIDGGSGSDSVTFQGVARSGGADIRNVESLNLQQGSVFTLNAALVLGDLDPDITGTATRTGAVAIDATSTLAAPGNYAIRAADPTALVTVTNAGLIQIASGGTAGNTLTIAGNYVGQGGAIAVNTVLAGDGSASDRLVISGGRASGDTRLRITNLGGAGAQTVQGIRVVETSNGGTTDAGAFRLATRVAAGAYEYRLFRGGSTSAEDWYLRSFLIPVEEPGTPVGPAVPLYRPELSLYAPAAAAARQIGLATLGTLQSRREAGAAADAGILGKTDGAPGQGAWARVIGERSRSRWGGTVEAQATGNLIGLQAGFDILRTAPYAGGHSDVVGVYVAYTDFNAPSVRGFADGVPNAVAGRLLVSGPSVGAYWTHTGPSGWYLDAVLQASWYDIATRSGDGTSLGTSATGYAASLAAGYPIRIAPGWQVEPSAQLTWQGISVDRARDAISTVDWDPGDALTGRIGARVQYTARTPEALWQPYAQVNLWHTFSGHDRVSLGSDAPIENRFGETALEVGAGITAEVSRSLSFFAHASYRWSIAGDSRQTATQGSIGLRVTW